MKDNTVRAIAAKVKIGAEEFCCKLIDRKGLEPLEAMKEALDLGMVNRFALVA